MKNLVLPACIYFLASCGLPHDIGQPGSYLIGNNSTVIDSVTTSIQHLIILQHDIAQAETLIYILEGELGKQDIGIEDMRRLSQRFGQFSLKFELSRSFSSEVTLPPTQNQPLLKLAEDNVVTLTQLDNQSMLVVGMNHFIPSLIPGQVNGYFASFPLLRQDVVAQLIIANKTLNVDIQIHTREIAATPKGEVLEITGPVNDKVDYLQIRILQEQIFSDENIPVDTLISGLMSNAAALSIHQNLLYDATPKACWRSHKELFIESISVRRKYQETDPTASVIINKSVNREKLDSENWFPTEAVEYPIYCSDYK
ncbi:MAG: hypothetical protein VYA34_14110 [Myxococcota bacterium]|nr:hypothetical protein [Myxococcota bacterium]